MAALDNVSEAGVQRAVLGTSAVTIRFVADAGMLGDRVAVGIDAVTESQVSGWTRFPTRRHGLAAPEDQAQSW
jgi:phosphoribosylformimino-5-aminoimidazole carboxamide ribonucleotide (ProFAR) isomerase